MEGRSINRGVPSVFVSYRRADGGYAARLHDDLADYFGAEQIFMDTHDVAPGTLFPSELTRALSSSIAVVALIGPNWNAELSTGQRPLDNPEDWVHKELKQGLGERKPVLPVLVDGVAFPQSLPQELTQLSHLNAISISNLHWRQDLARLVDVLEELGVPSLPREAFPEEPPKARVEARDAWLATSTIERSWQAINAFLTHRGMRHIGQEGSILSFQGGDKARARLFGGFSGPDSQLPTAGKIRVLERGPKLQMEALIREAWGRGFLGPLKGRYRSVLDQWLRDLRRATGGTERIR